VGEPKIPSDLGVVGLAA
jgi:hypothetical protein